VTSTAERPLTGAWRFFFAAWKFFGDFPRVLPYLRPYWKLEVGSVSAIGFGVLASPQLGLSSSEPNPAVPPEGDPQPRNGSS
jgi:hypothetical protein